MATWAETVMPEGQFPGRYSVQVRNGIPRGQPSTPRRTVFDVPAPGTVAAVVTGGGASFLNGSGMGTVEDCQLAGRLVKKPAGALLGPPVTPKLLPLKLGPPPVKSIC